MVLSISLVGVYALCLTHCHTHVDHSSHHHCDSHSTECQGHSEAMRHSCAIDNEMEFEYVASGVVSELKVASVVLLFLTLNPTAAESDDSEEYDRWRSSDLYSEHIPALGLLRAPPVLV